ncbi:MAG: hypothetical protein Q9227_002089 [Pyrenula ochraceoflavens]
MDVQHNAARPHGQSPGHSSPPGTQDQPSSASNQSTPAQGSGSQRIRRRNRMITSCLECRRRKLKCDRLHPCTNCGKFGRDCVFLAPALDSASQMRLTQIKEKMGSLERVLENDVAKNKEKSAASKAPARRGKKKQPTAARLPGVNSSSEGTDSDNEPEDERDLEPTPFAIEDAAYLDDGDDDDLLDLGYRLGKMRLTERIGGLFRPKIAEEVNFTLGGPLDGDMPPPPSGYALGPAGSGRESFLEPGPSYIAPRSGFFFNVEGQSSSIIDYLPSRFAADQLVEQYYKAVHPVAHVLHWSSFQTIYDNFWNNVSLGVEPPAAQQAIVFAVLFSAVVSFQEEDILGLFGVNQKSMTETFQAGTEMSLARANFLRTTKASVLQALVIYMIPMCRSEMSRAHSTMIGAAIRLAECMGLHRDPSTYGADPIECQVRRALWYHLCMLDIRTCEVQGPRPGIRREDFDTQLPLNIDDADLAVLNNAYSDQNRFTDMTLTRIRFECNEMHRLIWVERSRLERKETTITSLLGRIESFRKAMLEKYTPLFDLSNPLHYNAKIVLDLHIGRFYISALHRYHVSTTVRIPDRLRQLILTYGTQYLEAGVTLDTDPRLRTWVWITGAYQQYHVALLLIVEVYTYPMRREADRIWRCLDYVFEEVIGDPSQPRDQKARLIMSEMVERANTYRTARKMRAPVNMMQTVLEAEQKQAKSRRRDILREHHAENMVKHARAEEERRRASASASPPATSNSALRSSRSPQPIPSPQHSTAPQSDNSKNATSWSFDSPITFFAPPQGYKTPSHHDSSSADHRSSVSSSGRTPPPTLPPQTSSAVEVFPGLTALRGDWGGGIGGQAPPMVLGTQSYPPSQQQQQPEMGGSEVSAQAVGPFGMVSTGQNIASGKDTAGVAGIFAGQDQPMLDIDWVRKFLPIFFLVMVPLKFAATCTDSGISQTEWDKLFPPEINTGDLNVTSAGI